MLHPSSWKWREYSTIQFAGSALPCTARFAGERQLVLGLGKHGAKLLERGCAVNNECLGFLGRKEGKHAITLEKGLKAAAVLGCAFRGPQAISDQSGADVQIGLNTSH